MIFLSQCLWKGSEAGRHKGLCCGDMLQWQKTCAVRIEVTCSRDALWVKVAGTKSQHVLAHANVAHTSPRDMLQWRPLVRTDNYCATAIWGIFCARDVSHEVQQVECCAACGVDKIFPKLLLHNISLHKGRSRCNICLGHVPATFSCVTSHVKTYTNDFPCMIGILFDTGEVLILSCSRG